MAPTAQAPAAQNDTTVIEPSPLMTMFYGLTERGDLLAYVR